MGLKKGTVLSWLPENISTFGPKIDAVIQTIYYIVGTWFVLTQIVLFAFIFRYRNKQGRKAAYEPGHGIKKLAWILIPLTLIVGFDLGIDVIQASVWHEVKIHLPKNPDQTIRISGKQFVWEFTHPGVDNKLDTPDDIKTQTDLYVPINKKILFELQAQDVLHSFWVPPLRLKQDAVPGRTIKGWFEATKTGKFEIACAELCGIGHGHMRGFLHILNETDYKKWVSEQDQPKDVFWD